MTKSEGPPPPRPPCPEPGFHEARLSEEGAVPTHPDAVHRGKCGCFGIHPQRSCLQVWKTVIDTPNFRCPEFKDQNIDSVRFDVRTGSVVKKLPPERGNWWTGKKFPDNWSGAALTNAKEFVAKVLTSRFRGRGGVNQYDPWSPVGC